MVLKTPHNWNFFPEKSSGTATISSNTTTVTIIHGIGIVPTGYNAVPLNEDALTPMISATASTLIVSLQIAPANNGNYTWWAIR